MVVHQAIGKGSSLIHKNAKVAFIKASWHGDLVDNAERGCVEEFTRSGISVSDSVDVYTVPGSLEIPFLAMRLARTGQYQAIIAFGFVVNGGIYRHDFVGHAVIDGLMRAQLDTDVPVFSAVLTPQEFRAEGNSDHPHHDFFFTHMHGKGIEVARACLAMLKELSRVSGKTPAALTLKRT